MLLTLTSIRVLRSAGFIVIVPAPHRMTSLNGTETILVVPRVLGPESATLRHRAPPCLGVLAPSAPPASSRRTMPTRLARRCARQRCAGSPAMPWRAATRTPTPPATFRPPRGGVDGVMESCISISRLGRALRLGRPARSARLGCLAGLYSPSPFGGSPPSYSSPLEPSPPGLLLLLRGFLLLLLQEKKIFPAAQDG